MTEQDLWSGAIPMEGWWIVHVDQPADDGKGQYYILQINEASENILFKKIGKMPWVCPQPRSSRP